MKNFANVKERRHVCSNLKIQLFSNFWPFIPACHCQSTVFFYIPNLISPLWFVITFPVFVYSVKQLFHDLPSFSPLTLKSDRDLIATYSITAKSNIKVVRVENDCRLKMLMKVKQVLFVSKCITSSISNMNTDMKG